MHDPHQIGKYAAHMHGIADYAAKLRDGKTDGRDLSEHEREDIECRITRLLTDAILIRREKP